ncbi:MAG: hypothetical protein Q4B45_10110 [Coriobacteriia bacterium]|nr:hypothetical protein [Coriobacteriia bacterium]
MSINLSRRSFIGSLAGFASALGLAACDSSNDASDAESPSESWSVEQDDELACLTVQVSGGNVVAMPGDGWAPREGYIQLQLSGSSIPGQEIEAVYRERAVLTVKLKASDQASTLDLLLTEYRLVSDQSNIDAVGTVKVDYGNGDVQEIQKAYE